MDLFLAYINKLTPLEADEEALVRSRATERTYRKGQYVVQEGDVCKHITFIEQGQLRTFYLDTGGHEHTVSLGIENWWAGDMGSFITQTPADFNVQCLATTKVVQITYDNMEQLYRELPKMERSFRMVIERAYASTQKRIVRNFSLTAKERYLLFCEEYPEIAQRFPQYMIASYLGITKEFLSHIRNQSGKKR